MARVEILVEEKSMKELLSILLPKILPEKWILDENYFIRSFEGKSDLQKNIPAKVKVLSNWHQQLNGVIILQDQDNEDCIILKRHLMSLCNTGNCLKLIRIVCKELESWYLGDFNSIQLAYPSFNANRYRNKSKFRNPDICNASNEIKKILPGFQKVSSAKKIAPFLDISNNKSESFNQFISGILLFFQNFN
jgi:hypothetical protein